MGDRATLLANCLNEPADDTARLVYADYLREQDDPATQMIGRFVWAGVTLARYRGTEPVTETEFFTAQAEMHEAAPPVLASQLPHLFGWHGDRVGWDQDDATPDRVTAAPIPPPTGESRRVIRARRQVKAQRGPTAVFERGMLTAVRLSLPQVRDRAGGLLAACPLERLELIDVPGLTVRVLGPEAGWRLSARLDIPASPAGGALALEYASPNHDGPSRAELVRLFDALLAGALTNLVSRAGDRTPAVPAETSQSLLAGLGNVEGHT